MNNKNTLENYNVNCFLNNFKKNEKQPDYVGSVEIEGKTYKVAMWKKTDKNGNMYFSQTFSEDTYKSKKTNTTSDNVNSDNDFTSNNVFDPF